ncbi:hypothetical protein DFH27DRAFT_611828 [Peziza echinospora]|nr:hypothetical protein DFH27DRAFT_611828 [Peziza echinospora]
MSITLNTPLSDSLNASIQEKLVEIGWSIAGEDSSPLSEYICLMLVNGKSQEQIAEELSGDLLGLAKEDDSATIFSQWLFAKVEELHRVHGTEAKVEEEQEHTAGGEEQSADGFGDASMSGGMDMDMGGAGENGGPPTGPKAMRAGAPRQGRDRLFNQLNKAMDRSSPDALRGVRHRPGERVEKQPPKGPRSAIPGGPRSGQLPGQQQGPPGSAGLRPGRGGGNPQMGRGGPAFPGPAGGIPPHLAAQLATMNPQQQMAFFQMIEQQNQILAGFVTGGFPAGPTPGMPPMPPQQRGPNGFRGPPQPPIHPQFGNQFVNPAHPHNAFGHPPHPHQQQQRPQRSLFDMIETPPQLVNPQTARIAFAPTTERQDEGMDESKDQAFFEDTEGTGVAMAEDNDPFKTACKFANGCTKPDCPFAHPTPLAVGRVNISFVEKCPYGVNCKNRKCIGAHPSPASNPAAVKPARPVIQADCKFFPNCKNPVCPFRHPEIIMPPCRNGAACTRPDCHFAHPTSTTDPTTGASTTHIPEAPPCRFNPCLNPACLFTHEEGQQQGAFDNKVWTAGGGKREHVSERKFTSGEEEVEELIIPGREPELRKVGGSGDGDGGEGQPGGGDDIPMDEEMGGGGGGSADGKPPGSAGSSNSSRTVAREEEGVH